MSMVGMQGFNVSDLQKSLAKYLRVDLPFLILVNRKPVAKVLPVDWMEEAEMGKPREILEEVIKYGVSYYRSHPEKISPTLLLQAMKQYAEMKKEDETESALMEGTYEALGEEPGEKDGQPQQTPN